MLSEISINDFNKNNLLEDELNLFDACNQSKQAIPPSNQAISPSEGVQEKAEQKSSPLKPGQTPASNATANDSLKVQEILQQQQQSYALSMQLALQCMS